MVYVNLPNEDVARNIVRRSILIKEIIDVRTSNNNIIIGILLRKVI